ncbi:hypothetical protein GW750_05155 [bacterium]|nr:hypothetical protein [bacterium]
MNVNVCQPDSFRSHAAQSLGSPFTSCSAVSLVTSAVCSSSVPQSSFDSIVADATDSFFASNTTLPSTVFRETVKRHHSIGTHVFGLLSVLVFIVCSQMLYVSHETLYILTHEGNQIVGISAFQKLAILLIVACDIHNNHKKNATFLPQKSFENSSHAFPARPSTCASILSNHERFFCDHSLLFDFSLSLICSSFIFSAEFLLFSF